MFRPVLALLLLLFLLGCETEADASRNLAPATATAASSILPTETPLPATPTRTATPRPSPTRVFPPPTPTPYSGLLKPGVWMEVTGTGSCLHIRTAPGLSAPAVSCQPDGFVVQLHEGPVEEDGHRWWRITGPIQQQEYPYGIQAIIKGWAAEEFLQARSDGVLSFEGVSVGDRFGDLTVEFIRRHRLGFLPNSPHRLGGIPHGRNVAMGFAGETVVTGDYFWHRGCGWYLLPSRESLGNFPRLPTDERDYSGFIFADREKARQILAPDAHPVSNLDESIHYGTATVVITNFLLVRYPSSCTQNADIVRVLDNHRILK